MQAIDRMRGIEFEQFCAELFRRKGFKVATTQASGDQGADLILEGKNGRAVVQAKRSKSKVGNWAVQEVLAAKGFYAARRAVECFFDNLIVEATVQFVEECQDSVRQLNAGRKPGAGGNAEFVQRITHVLREPLGPLLLGLEVLLREESLSPRGVEMIGLLHRGVKKEADAIEELLRSTELLEKDAAR